LKKGELLRKTLAIVLVLSLMLTLAACGGAGDNQSTEANQQQPNDGAPKAHMIGYNIWGSGNPTFDVMAAEIEYSLEVLGLQGSKASDDFTADKELSNIQNFIAAEVDGILMQANASPVLPQAAKDMKSAKIPFALGIFVGEDPDREIAAADNEYYAGAVNADMYYDGYIIGVEAAKNGHKTAVLIGGNVGDHHFEERIAGFTQSFVEEGGGEILDTARCSSPAEAQEKANALLSANRDADCLYAMVADYVPGSINAQDTLDLDMPIYSSVCRLDTANYIKEGRVIASGAGNDLAAGVALALLANTLDGHPILDDNGKPPELKLKPFLITKENVDDFVSIFFTDGEHPITEERLKSLAWRYNEDVSYETFIDFVENRLTMEGLMEDHQS
jgi:ABC-type sugar transport system substrate-binding protein